MMRKVSGGVALVAALMLGGFWLAGGDHPPAVTIKGTEAGEGPGLAGKQDQGGVVSPPASHQQPARDASQTLTGPAYATPEKPDRLFAPSLEDTDIDGRLVADATGHLVLGIEVRDFFDYFLNTVGERSPEEVIDEILRYARTYLPQPAAEEVRQLLAAYLDYKSEALAWLKRPLPASAQQSPGALQATLEESFEALRRIRRMYFPPDAVQAFFAMEEAYASYTLERLKLRADENLAPEQRALREAELVAHLPEPLRQVEEEAVRQAARQARIQQVLDRAGSEAALRSELAQLGVSPVRVEQLAETFRQDRAFEQAYSRYRAERDRVLAGVTEMAQKKSRLAQLRGNFFTEPAQVTLAQLRDMDELEMY